MRSRKDIRDRARELAAAAVDVPVDGGAEPIVPATGDLPRLRVSVEADAAEEGGPIRGGQPVLATLSVILYAAGDASEDETDELLGKVAQALAADADGIGRWGIQYVGYGLVVDQEGDAPVAEATESWTVRYMI